MHSLRIPFLAVHNQSVDIQNVERSSVSRQQTDMTTVLLAAIAILLALILAVLSLGLSREQRGRLLRYLRWAGGILVALGFAVGELIWFQSDHEGALGFLAVACGIAAIFGVRRLSSFWSVWPPNTWRALLLLRKIHRDTAPPLQFLTAKTVFIEEKDNNLDIKGTAYRELLKWGRFEIVTDRAKADLILSLSMKRPGAAVGTWNEPRLEQLFEQLGDLGKVKAAIGYATIAVADPLQEQTLLPPILRFWQSHPRSITRELVREFQKTVRETEKWYDSK